MTKVMWIGKKEEINPMWILYDNESTIDIIKNKEMITNIQNTKNPIAPTGIGGEPIKVTLEGDLLGYGTVFHHPRIAANILSFFRMAKRFKVKYDNMMKDAFEITCNDGSKLEFIPLEEGLYHYDFNLSIKRKLEMEKKNEKVMVINTVENTKRNFMKKELEKADQARRLYVIVGRPSRKAFEEMIKAGKIINNAVTVQDYRNALEIYGIDLGILKGKTVRSKPEEIKNPIYGRA
jgi:hypothetical protein